MPIFVASSLAPKNAGTFFLLDDKYFRGGYQIWPTLTERDDILSINRKAGMLVYVQSDQTLYSLDDDLVNWSTFTVPAGAHTHAPADISLGAGYVWVTPGQVTTWDGKQDALSYVPESTLTKNQPSGYAGLDSNGLLFSSQLPQLSITDTSVVGSEAAMLALTAQTGDVCVRTDLQKSFILKGATASVLADWQELLTPTQAGVQSIQVSSPLSNTGTAQIPNLSIQAATTSAPGYLSAADKTKLDGIAAGANAYVHPTGDGNLHVPATSTTNNGKVLTAGATAGSISWQTPASTGVTSVSANAPIVSSGGLTPVLSMAAASSTTNGYLSSADWITFNSKGTGTVTSVAGAGSANGLSLSGTVTSTGSISLVGSITSVSTAANIQMNSLGVGTAAAGTAGDIRATGDVTAYYSDARLKDVLCKIPNALSKVMQLNGVMYHANEVAASFGYDTKKIQVGLLAQEVQAVLPDVVTPAPFDIGVNDEGVEISKSGENYLTLKYERLVPLLVEAIKDQQRQIDELKAALK